MTFSKKMLASFRSGCSLLSTIWAAFAVLGWASPAIAGTEPGGVAMTMHPSAHVRRGDTERVSFGLPLPEGTLEDAKKLRVVTAEGKEIAIAVQPMLRWVNPHSGATLKSWRAVLIQLDWKFSDLSAQELQIEWNGPPRTQNLGKIVAHDNKWTIVNDSEYPAGAVVREPKIYVTLPASYLSRSGVFPDTFAFDVSGRERDFRFIDEAQVNFFATAINDVGPKISQSEKISYLTDNEPWLYDRAATFFRLYVRSGQLQHLRSAHRAAVFYAQHVSGDGFFDLKRERDAKYSYSESLFADMLLFGDNTLRRKIEDVTRATAKVRLRYSNPEHFWTERHVAYRVLNAVVAFEATGQESYFQQATADINSLIRMQNDPPVFIPARLRQEGCFIHTALSHGEGNENEYVCSPWMSVLIAGAFQRYDSRQDDRQIGASIMRLADFVLGPGSRIEGKWIDGPRPKNPRIPYYLATREKVLEGDPWSDKEHALDVSKITALAYRYAKRIGDSRAETYRQGTIQLIAAARANLEQWIRPDGPLHGKPIYRLSPSRKFNWWFNPYHDVEFLISAQ